MFLKKKSSRERSRLSAYQVGEILEALSSSRFLSSLALDSPPRINFAPSPPLPSCISFFSSLAPQLRVRVEGKRSLPRISRLSRLSTTSILLAWSSCDMHRDLYFCVSCEHVNYILFFVFFVLNNFFHLLNGIILVCHLLEFANRVFRIYLCFVYVWDKHLVRPMRSISANNSNHSLHVLRSSYSFFSSLFASTFRTALKEKDVKTVVVVYVGH